MADTENEKSVGWVALMVALVILYFGWAFLAAEYYKYAAIGVPEETNFWVNSIVQLANLSSVIGYAFSNRLWAVILIGVLEVGVFFGWFGLKKVEKHLNSRDRR